MKKYTFLLAIAVLMLGCEDSSDPNDFFDENNNGAYLRTLNLSPNFNLNDIDTARFEVTLEERDEEGGALLSSVNVYASFVDNTTDVQDISVNEVLFTVFQASDFDLASGFPTITHVITANEITAFLGLNPIDLAATDLFIFRYELLLTDGRIFSVVNSGTDVTDVTNTFFNSPFIYNAPLVCPVDSSYAVGVYELSTTIPGVFGVSFSETVNVSIGSSETKRTFTATWLPALGFGNSAPYQFDLVCGNVIFDDEQATGLQCSIGVNLSAGETNTSYDENDDSIILINFTENTQGDCGAPPTQNQLSLTRQ